ncbi:hypothetical protein OC725_00235 ['Bituminaria bituminosa' little leaf phytoplasma]|uniref:Group II intron reverse transcriptase/maturase n=1 Tax=Candidatus Phytoplasma fabacearum TaxID=2982628 RepID=A0ABU8ZRW6_9MOLU
MVSGKELILCQQQFQQRLNFSRTLGKIQYRSTNGGSLKRELQQGMNNFYNTLMAFNKIATNKEAGTPGIDNKTIDGINLERLKRYHLEYVNNGYNSKPVKRIFIPNDNKKTKPLGIPTIKDRLIQNLFRMEFWI